MGFCGYAPRATMVYISGSVIRSSTTPRALQQGLEIEVPECWVPRSDSTEEINCHLEDTDTDTN